jgi:hypothetical protein
MFFTTIKARPSAARAGCGRPQAAVLAGANPEDMRSSS